MKYNIVNETFILLYDGFAVESYEADMNPEMANIIISPIAQNKSFGPSKNCCFIVCLKKNQIQKTLNAIPVVPYIIPV